MLLAAGLQSRRGGPALGLEARASHRPAQGQGEGNESPLFDGAVGKFQKSIWESTLTLALEGLWVETPEGFATCPLSDVCRQGSPVIISSLLKPAPAPPPPLRSGRILFAAPRNRQETKTCWFPQGGRAAGRRVVWGTWPAAGPPRRSRAFPSSR